jgi:ABC-type phosphate transport system substrate-binding protein
VKLNVKIILDAIVPIHAKPNVPSPKSLAEKRYAKQYSEKFSAECQVNKTFESR